MDSRSVEATHMTRKKLRLALMLITLLLLTGISADKPHRISLVGDSLLEGALDIFVDVINRDVENTRLYTKHVKGGTTAYNNPINQQIHSDGPEDAFGSPDVVVFSFATNEMADVAFGKRSMGAAIAAMQTLIEQAVAAGATCIVMLESTHRIPATFPQSAGWEIQMNAWFEYWHRRAVDNQYPGTPYRLLFATVSPEITANIAAYTTDGIHFSTAGANIAAQAVVEQIDLCPGIT
jgi:lysophospholipase L1-like esterase